MNDKKHDELQLRDEWNKEIETIKTTEELKTFVEKMVYFNHDYGTIVNGMVAAMMATMKVIDNSPQGGISGFQASCVGWTMVENLFGGREGSPKRLLDFDNLLYPSHEDQFTAIDNETWKWIQREAKQNLESLGKPYTKEADKAFYGEDAVREAHPKVKAHWESIAAGNVPFGLKVEE